MTFHNRKLTLVVCVAAAAVVAVSSCSASNNASPHRPAPSTPTPSMSAPETLGTPRDGYDEWKYWSSGEADAKMLVVVKMMGLTAVDSPTKFMSKQGFVGVAPLSDGCIITFSTNGVSHYGNFSAAILPRYDPNGLIVSAVDQSVPQLRALVIDHFATCTITRKV